MTLIGQGREPDMLEWLEIHGDMEHLSDMGNGESNGHVTDDVTLPRKAKVVTPLCLTPIISKTAGDTDLVAMEYL